MVTDLTKKVLKIMSNVLPPNHSDAPGKQRILHGWSSFSFSIVVSDGVADLHKQYINIYKTI